MKHIVCYSGGKGSALVAAMLVRDRPGQEVVLLNHRVNAEPVDVARFEEEVAAHLGLPITYADGDTDRYPSLTPLEVSLKEGAFSVVAGPNRNVLCTHRLKTEPFMRWLRDNYSDGDVIYYGFGKGEMHRAQRRSTILGKDGYKTDYPLLLWDNPLDDTWFASVGIEPPMQYQAFKHANCIGCIKAKKQHWYCVFVHARSVFDDFSVAEDTIGNSIMRHDYLEDLRPMFEKMQELGIAATEHTPPGGFWADAKRQLRDAGVAQGDLFGDDEETGGTLPCECVV